MKIESHWTDRLVELRTCDEAVTWAKAYPTAEAAWAACERGDWMLWWAGRESGEPGSPSRRKLVGAAAACAREVLPIFESRRPGDTRVRECIETCERHALGEDVNMIEARRAASAAADDDYADYAASAADADYVASDIYYAAASAAARAAMRSRCAEIVRQHYPSPPTKESREPLRPSFFELGELRQARAERDALNAGLSVANAELAKQACIGLDLEAQIHALRAELAEARAFTDRHWEAISAAMPYVPGSSFVARMIDDIEEARKARTAPAREETTQ